MWLQNNWQKLSEYRGTPEEFDQLPFTLATGTYRGHNTCNENLVTIGHFLRLRKPKVVVECGTLEARTTEYMAKLLSQLGGGKIYTIDVAGCIDHMDKDLKKITFKNDPLYDELVNIRRIRLDLLQYYEKVEVVYWEGFTADVLPQIIAEDQVDFVYQDASHLHHILQHEWGVFLDAKPRKGIIVCYDDMAPNYEFVKWFQDQTTPTWYSNFLPIERGQLWAEKVK